MAVTFEAGNTVPIVIALATLFVYYLVERKAGTGLSLCGVFSSAAITVSTIAMALAPTEPVLQASTDLGIMLAGAVAFAASGWLLFACRVAGDARDR